MAPTAAGDKKPKVTWGDQGANQNKRRPQVRFSPPPPGRIAKTPAYVPPHMRTPDVAVKRKKVSPSKGPKQPLLRPLAGPMETPSTGEKLPSPLLPPGPPPVFYDPMKSGMLAKRRVPTPWWPGEGLSAANFVDEDEDEDDENMSDDSEEIVRAKGYKDTENPFVDAGGLKKPPRRDLIDELLKFKKNDGSTGYPPLERDVGVPQEEGEFRMPIPSLDETPPPRWQRGRQPQNWDHEYPGAQVGDYSTLRGGVRNRWPGMVWTQEEVDELGLNPNHEGTSVLERGSPQELKHLGPAWQVLGKIKKGPWQDRLVLPRLRSSAANPKLPVAEADGPKKVVQERQFISEREAGFWRENPDDKDFSLEYHQHAWERGQRLLTKEEAADLKVPGFKKDWVSENFGKGFFDRMRKKFRTRPETENDRDPVYQAKNAQLKEELLQRAARKEDNNLESVFRRRRRDVERAEKQKRITELDDEEDEPMKDAEEEELEPELVPPGAPKAMMVRSGGETDSPGGSSGYECDDSPVGNRCIACRALGKACNGHVPCRHCIRSKMQCRMPPNPTSSLPVNLPEDSNVFETPENPRGIGRRLGSSSADTLISSGATINNTPGDIFQAAAGLLPPRPAIQWEADPDDNFDLDVDTEPISEHWAAHAPPGVGEGPDLGPCQHCITKGIQGTCRPNHDIGLECSSCAGIRVRGDLGHECRVNNILYRPRRHAVTRNRYRGIKGAIVYRCDGCDAARKKDCDVDPFVRAACTHCSRAGKQCTWHLDRRRPPRIAGNILVMLPRLALRENNNLGAMRLVPWWRRGCVDCVEKGERCSWLNDYRTIGYRCKACCGSDKPCVDSEAPDRKFTRDLELGSTVFHSGRPMISDPRVVPRGFGGLGACQTCSIIAGKPGACAEQYKLCYGWAGADGYACLRCTTLGLPCVTGVARPGTMPPVLPYVDRELIGYGSGYPGTALTFPACRACVQNNRWCDRMRPCHECKIRDLPCRIGGLDEGFGLGLIPRVEFEQMGVAVRAEYWMALGYGTNGPSGDRTGIPTGEIVGPSELAWVVYDDLGGGIPTDAKGAAQFVDIRQRRSASDMARDGPGASTGPEVTSSNAAGGSEAGSEASNNSPKSVMTFHTLSPPVPPPGPPADIDPDAVQTVMPEVTPPGPGRRMSLFHNGFQQQPKRLVNGVVVIDDRPLEPGAISFVNTPRAEVHGNTIIPDGNTIPEDAPEQGRPNEPTTFGDSFMSNSDLEPEPESNFNNTSHSFNASQPEGHVLGSDLSPFTVARSPAARAADYDDNFLRELAEQGPDPRSSASASPPARDTWADVAELAGVAAEDRFTRAYLGVHKGISLGVVPDGRNVPPLQRILLTLEGSDTHAVAAANPYVLPPERSDMPSRNALARHLMSTWASPGIDVLRDIPDEPQLLPLAQDHNRCQDYGTEGDPPPCGALVTRSGPSHCENIQHIANHDPNAIQPTYVCDTCDEITTNNLLIGPASLTSHDFQAMRTYACDSCSSAEYVSPGVIMPYDASLVSGCSCASKLLQRRLCSAHRYTLAGALVINTLIIREWQLVNFPPSFCLFCKKTSHGTESNKSGSRLLYDPPTVYFCVNCQTRVADPDRSGTLFYGCKIGPLGTVVQDQRGQAIVGALYRNNKKLGNSLSSKEPVPPNRSETPDLDMMEID